MNKIERYIKCYRLIFSCFFLILNYMALIRFSKTDIYKSTKKKDK